MDEDAILPAHIETTVEAIARLHADHLREAGALQRLVENMTAWIGRPVVVAGLSVVLAAWVGGNVAAQRAGLVAWDVPPFPWLEDALSALALYVTILILATQRRENQLAVYREQLSLELAILGEQKSAKIIAMLLELRAEQPGLRGREDAEAEAMGVAADPDAMLAAIRRKEGAPPPPRDLSEEVTRGEP